MNNVASVTSAADTSFLNRWRLFAGVFCFAFLVSPIISFVTSGRSHVTIISGLLVVLVYLILFIGPLPYALLRPKRWTPWATVLVVVMTALTVLFGLLAGHDGLTLVGYTSIAICVAFAPVIAAPLLLLLATVTLLLPEHFDRFGTQGLDWSDFASVFITAFFGFAMRYGVWSRQRLDVANRDIEALAAEQERLRIARDLHDLLGHSLTTITLKAEVAAKLVERDPHRAMQEMQQVVELARSGLVDVRAAVAGYREVGLATELASTREVLRSAGISAELPASVEGVDDDVRELFGWVLREGMTNVVRHSRANRVRVTVEARAITIADDGVGGTPAAGGNGLRGLTERVTAAGGVLQIGKSREGGFELRVEVAK